MRRSTPLRWTGLHRFGALVLRPRQDTPYRAHRLAQRNAHARICRTAGHGQQKIRIELTRLTLWQYANYSVKLYSLRYDELRTYLFAAAFAVGEYRFPALCHAVPQGGVRFLPIYFFTLVGAYKYGWRVGMLVAVLSPLVNSALFGMPGSGEPAGDSAQIGADSGCGRRRGFPYGTHLFAAYGCGRTLLPDCRNSWRVGHERRFDARVAGFQDRHPRHAVADFRRLGRNKVSASQVRRLIMGVRP